MKGAGRRLAQQRAALAEASWIGANADHKDLVRYLENLDPDREPLTPEALAGQMRSFFSGVPKIRRDDFLKGRT